MQCKSNGGTEFRQEAPPTFVSDCCSPKPPNFLLGSIEESCDVGILDSRLYVLESCPPGSQEEHLSSGKRTRMYIPSMIWAGSVCTFLIIGQPAGSPCKPIDQFQTNRP